MKLRRTKNGANFIAPIFGPPCTVQKVKHAVIRYLNPYLWEVVAPSGECRNSDDLLLA